MQFLYNTVCYFFALIFFYPSPIHASEKLNVILRQYITAYPEKDKKESAHRDARLAARKALSLAQRKEYDEKFRQLLMTEENIKTDSQGNPWTCLKPLAKLSLNPINTAYYRCIYGRHCWSCPVYSIEPNIKEEYREYDTMWQRIATDYLNAGVNINVKDEQGNSIAVSNLAKSHFRTYAQANFVRDSTDVVLSHPTQPMEDFYYGYEYVNFAEQEKILWQQLNGSTENTAQLSTKLLNFVPVTALTASVIEYLKPLPFDDHLTHQAHVRTQHRLAFEQADAQAPALTASQAPSRKRKKSCCKLFSWKK